MPVRTPHDIIIIGGGIAGLTVANTLAQRGRNILLLEYYPNFGGRVVTFRDPEIGQYEIGAGRIFHKHTRVKALVKKYDLHTYPISADSYFNSKPNTFLELFSPIRRVCESLDAGTLARHTIKELLPREYTPLLEMFPYRAEVDLMRADLALASFAPKYPMGADTDAAFFGVVEGLDSFTARIADEAQHAGAVLKPRHRVSDIRRINTELFEITGQYGKKAEEKPFVYFAKQVIIATCRCNLGKFSILQDAPLLKQLATSPLLRIYAKYPPDATTGKIWFEDIPKTVTAGKLRYVIPINSKTGLIMISYTDGDDTKFWKELEGNALQHQIQAEVKALFPTKSIPNPIYLQKHYWGGGCTYWLPGDYNVDEASKQAMNPSPNLFVVGESISKQQAWIEGALESAETLLDRFF
jgi:hypothetical protein